MAYKYGIQWIRWLQIFTSSQIVDFSKLQVEPNENLYHMDWSFHEYVLEAMCLSGTVRKKNTRQLVYWELYFKTHWYFMLYSIKFHIFFTHMMFIENLHNVDCMELF